MSKVGGTLKNIIVAIFRGELLLHLKVDRYFLHIIYVFILIVAATWISLKVDLTLVKEENNKRRLEDLEIYYAEQTDRLVSEGRLSTVESNLQKLGSPVQIPGKPAIRISENGKE